MKPPPDPPKRLNKVCTDIAGLDEILEGGLPRAFQHDQR